MIEVHKPTQIPSGEELQNCQFCNPGRVDFPHFETHGARGRLDLHFPVETPRLKLRPDILPGSSLFHGLLIPKTHRYSTACSPEISDEVGRIMFELEHTIGPIIYAEHGAARDGGRIQSIYHQHAHLYASHGLRIVDSMADFLAQLGISYQIIETPDSSPVVNLQGQFDRGGGYLFIQQKRTGLIAYDPKDDFPSQIIQKRMSELLNRGMFLNWKEIGRKEELDKLSVQRMTRQTLEMLETCLLR